MVDLKALKARQQQRWSECYNDGCAYARKDRDALIAEVERLRDELHASLRWPDNAKAGEIGKLSAENARLRGAAQEFLDASCHEGDGYCHVRYGHREHCKCAIANEGAALRRLLETKPNNEEG